MKLAIISDIHSNFEALKSVYEDINKRQIKKIINLGDIVGYGPQPNECIEFLREYNIKSIKGNHDSCLINSNERKFMNDYALDALEINEKIIKKENLEYLINLDNNYFEEDLFFVHAFPPDSYWKYLEYTRDKEIIEMSNKLNKYKIFFIGHNHNLKGIQINENNFITRSFYLKGKYKLNSKSKYILNVGSVGQPRLLLNPDNSVNYMIYNNKKKEVETINVNYDMDKTIYLMKKLNIDQFIIDQLFEINYFF